MRVHVTGARGFIASHLLSELERRGHEGTGSDVEHALAPELFLTAGEPIGAVVHAGALVGRELRGMGAQRAVELNVTSTAILANACAGLGLPLLYVSTSEVYGPAVDGTIAYEDDPLLELPHNLYGLTKRWGEEAARLAFRDSPELLTIARLSMPYGPGHPPGSGRAALTNFLWAAMHGEPLLVHRGASRSWCWVGDTVRALAILVERFARPRDRWDAPAIYNVGRSDNELPMRTVAELVLELVEREEGVEGDFDVIDPPAGFSLAKRLDTYRLLELEWAPRVELEEGMRLTYQWLRDNRGAFYR